MSLTITTDSDEDSDSESDNDMMDEDDRQLIDRALQQSTSTETDTDYSTSTKPRRNLAHTQMLQQFHPTFWKLYYSYSDTPNISATRLCK